MRFWLNSCGFGSCAFCSGPKKRTKQGPGVLRISPARSFAKELLHNLTSRNLACTSFSLAQNLCKPRTPCMYLVSLTLMSATLASKLHLYMHTNAMRRNSESRDHKLGNILPIWYFLDSLGMISWKIFVAIWKLLYIFN